MSKDDNRIELMKDKVSLDNPSDFRSDKDNLKILQEEAEQLRAELTQKFTKEQFRQLAELIDTEIEIEKYYNQ